MRKHDRHITVNFIREEIQDRFPGDNTIDCDIFFTDEDIEHAMEMAANRINAITPIGVVHLLPWCMPKLSFIVDAVVASLYKSAIHKLNRNLMDWNTGETKVSLESVRKAAFEKAYAQLQQEWIPPCKEWKAEINRNQVYMYV